MNGRVIGTALLSVLVLLPVGAAGQNKSEKPWGPGTTLSVFVGAASPDAGTSGVAGASLGWELNPYLAIEGGATWIGKQAGVASFQGLLRPRVRPFSGRSVSPSFYVGVGMLRASVDVNDPDLPAFYAQRGGVAAQIFEDFAVGVGGGVDLFLNHHLAIRPEVLVTFATSDASSVVVPMFGVQLAYHFEAHPYLEQVGR